MVYGMSRLSSYLAFIHHHLHAVFIFSIFISHSTSFCILFILLLMNPSAWYL
jgi:hypothetical protein